MTSYALGAVPGLAAGAYIRWAVRPVLTAYTIGRLYERMKAVRRAARWN